MFARDILGVGASGQGDPLARWRRRSRQLGYHRAIGDRLPRINIMLGGVTLYGMIIVAFAFSPWFSFSLVLMIIVGIVHVTSHALAQTVIQTYSPAEFRGRTMAIFHMTHVVLLAGGIPGALSSIVGVSWAAASVRIAGRHGNRDHRALPQARLIRGTA